LVIADRAAHQQGLWSPAVSCLPRSTRLLAVLSAYPGGPSPCPADYRQALGYYAASAFPSACWHFRIPFRGKAAWEFPSSGVNDVVATRSCLLYAGWIRDNMCTVWQPTHPPPSLLGRVIQPRAPVARNDASVAGSSRQHRSQGWSVIRLVVGRCRTFVRRLQTPGGATARRPPRSPRPVVPGRLLRSNRSHC
jgi:hypothetical protein